MSSENGSKKEIADAFKRHFDHFGFKKTSVDDIVKELKISKKTIYQHFNTKEEIFYYIVYRVAVRFRDKMDKELLQFPTYLEKLEKLVKKIFADTKKWLKAKNDAFEFKYKYEISALAFQDAYNELIKTYISQGVSKGEFREVPVDLTVRFINGIFQESMKLVAANPDLEVEEHVIEAIFRLLV